MDRKFGRIHGKIADDIATYDWHVIASVAKDRLPAYGYTIGLAERFDHPEIILIGLPPKTIQLILNSVGEYVRKGGRIVIGADYVDEFISNIPVKFVEVRHEHYPRYLQYAIEYYRNEDFVVMQLIWPDKLGQFPWEDKYDPELKFVQPMLDRNIDFPFMEERNLGVYTTRQVLEDRFPVLAVYHDHDGDWQFLCDTTSDISDLRIVALEQMAKIDRSICELFDLPIGWKAVRENADSAWTRESYPDSDPETEA